MRLVLVLDFVPEKRETIDNRREDDVLHRAIDRRLRSIGCAELENNRMRITRKRKKRKKPGEEDGSEARMQNRARAGARPSMMAWFATMVMMLLALVNACIVVDGSVVSLNMHRHDTRVKEMRTHDVSIWKSLSFCSTVFESVELFVYMSSMIEGVSVVCDLRRLHTMDVRESILQSAKLDGTVKIWPVMIQGHIYSVLRR